MYDGKVLLNFSVQQTFMAITDVNYQIIIKIKIYMSISTILINGNADTNFKTLLVVAD